MSIGEWWRDTTVAASGMRAEEPELYGLDKKRLFANDYIGYNFYRRSILPALNDSTARVLTDNKWIFYQIMRAFGLPIPTTLALFDPVFGVSADREPCTTADQLVELLNRSQPPAMVVKPAGGIQGKHLLILDEIDYTAGTAKVRTGGVVDLADELRALPTVQLRSNSSGYVIQELVEQHAFLSGLNPNTTNTVRLVTHVARTGEVQTPFAIVRLGRAGNLADSWRQGGLSVGVDPATGRMSSGIIKPKHGGGWFDVHPDTGVRFAGCTLPMWDDLVKVCTHAARLFPGVRSIGWDVVIGPEGPIVLEANEEWDLTMVQVHTNGWLSLPGARRDFLEYGIPMPARHLMAPTVLRDMAKHQKSLLARAVKPQAAALKRRLLARTQ